VIVSADAFENLKPAPDIFLAASRILNVPPSEVYGIRLSLLSRGLCFNILDDWHFSKWWCYIVQDAI